MNSSNVCYSTRIQFLGRHKNWLTSILIGKWSLVLDRESRNCVQGFQVRGGNLPGFFQKTSLPLKSTFICSYPLVLASMTALACTSPLTSQMFIVAFAESSTNHLYCFFSGLSPWFSHHGAPSTPSTIHCPQHSSPRAWC